LILDGELAAAMLNSFGQVAVGLVVVWLGIVSVRVVELM
jgi:fluoride ion exporter CrcB/FEX